MRIQHLLRFAMKVDKSKIFDCCPLSFWCFRYVEWKSQIFHSIFTYSLVALIDEIKPSVAFLLSSKLIFSQSSR